MINKVNNNHVNFTGQLNVNITEEFLENMKNSPIADTATAKLLHGIKFLERVTPKIGTDKDIFTLSNIAPEDRLYFKGSNNQLLLSLNDRYYKVITEHYSNSIKEKLAEICTEVLEGHHHITNIPTGYAENNLIKIKSFNKQV